MFRYRLRTLLIVLALGPPLLSRGWAEYNDYILRRRIADLDDEIYQVLSRAPSPRIGWHSDHEHEEEWSAFWLSPAATNAPPADERTLPPVH